jgi:hypothetical protein
VRFAEQRVTFELRPGVEPIDKSGPPRSQATPLPGSGPDEPVGGLPTGQK